MKTRRLSIREMMNGKKDPGYVKRMCSKYKIPQFYIFCRKLGFTSASFIFCQRMHELGKLARDPFPDGEVLLVISGHVKFWASTSIDSLIDIKENRREPWLCMDFNKSNK